MGSKSERTTLRLEDIAFSCGCSVFAVTATETDLQAAKFVPLTFTTQNNGARGEKIGHKDSGEPLLFPKDSLLWRILHLRANKAPPSTPLDHVMNLTGR